MLSLGAGRYIDSGPVGDAAAARGTAGRAKGLSAAQARRVEARQVPPRVTRRSGGDMEQRVRSSLGTAAERAGSRLSAAGTVPTMVQK